MEHDKPAWVKSPEELARPRSAPEEAPWVTGLAWLRYRNASPPSTWIEIGVNVAEEDDKETWAILYKRRSCLYKRRSCALSSREIYRTPAGNA